MKKLLLVLGMVTCILGVSACGSKQEETAARTDINEESALNYGDQLVQSIAMICSDEQYAGDKAQLSQETVFAAAITSWESALEDMGSYVEITDHTAEIREDGVTINVAVDGTEHDANVEILLDKDLMVTSITTNVIYSFGELMEKAFLNTLLGMGTVFAVLILIYLIITCFKFIPKLQAAFTKKPEEQPKAAAVDNTIAQIIEKEELSDDLELAAVIAAAVAACEGAVSTDGFVVRSIRKRRTF